MRLRYYVACIVAAVMGLSLTVMRLVWTPADTVESGLYTATLCVIGIALLALFFLCGARPRVLSTAAGTPALLTACAAAWVGTALVISAINGFADLRRGVYPYPQPFTVTVMTRVLAALLILSAALGGVFFLVTAVRWFVNRRTDRCSFGVLALCPVVWTWVRLLWYITSFTSAVNRYRSVTEVILLVFELLFLMSFARYASGVEEKAPRFTMPIALGTAMLGFVACITRFGAYLMQDAVLFDGSALITAPDLAIALLAALFAGLQLFAAPLSEPSPAPEGDDGSDETPPPLAEDYAAEILPDAVALTSDDDDDEEYAANDEDRRPLELEDIINEIIRSHS